MRKRRADSPWSELDKDQQELMDQWFFDENLSHAVILEKAGKEFGIKASRQTLTAYFRYRELMLSVPDGAREQEPMEEKARVNRIGAGMDLSDLQARTLHFAVMAVYEMSLAEPEKMRIGDIRSLMKMVNENQRLMMENRTRREKFNLQSIMTELKVKKEEFGKQTKEEFERMMFDATDIMHRAQKKCAENRAEMDAEKQARMGAANVNAEGEESSAGEDPEAGDRKLREERQTLC